MPKSKDFQMQWAKVVAKAWTDEKFKQKLLKNPEQTLKEYGIEVPKGYKFQVHEEKNKVIHLHIPKKPDAKLSEDDLQNISGGKGCQDCFSNVCKICSRG